MSVNTLSGIGASWSGTVTLNSTSDSILAVFNDRFGRQYYDTITINFLDTQSIEITYPNITSHDTRTSFITISGTSRNSQSGDTVQLFVDGNVMTTNSITGLHGAWSGSVTLNGLSDSVVAVFNDRFGRLYYDTINVNYFIPPTIEISYPNISLHDTRAQSIYVNGTSMNSQNGDTIQIFVDGVAMAKTTITGINGTWSGTAILNSICDSVVAVVNDQFGRQYYDTITINFLDTQSIEITSPTASTLDTNAQTLTISGTSRNSQTGDTVQLYVDSVYMSINTITGLNGSWTGTVILNGSSDSVLAVFNDRFGRQYYDTITINYFQPPSVKVTYPPNNTDTEVISISIQGTSLYTGLGDTVDIYVNSVWNSRYTLTGFNGTWNGTAHLNAIGDSIQVKLTDRFNTVKYDTVTINYYAPIGIGITSPSTSNSSADTLSEYITLTGTTRQTNAGDTVRIYVGTTYQSIYSITGFNGAFSGTARLTNQADSVYAVLNDRFNRFDTTQIYVRYFDTVTIKITYPSTQSETIVTSITISGTSSDVITGDTVEIYKNGVKQSQYAILAINGTWSGTAAVSGQGDSITVKLSDKFGRSSYDTITIHYFSAPIVKITYP